MLLRQWTGAIFKYAIATLRAKYNPAEALSGAVRKPAVRHNPPLERNEIGDFLIKLDAYPSFGVVTPAIRILMLTFVRTAELRQATWDQIDLDEGLWRLPAAAMKMKEAHIVPLSDQAKAIFTELHKFTGHRSHIFHNMRRPTEPISPTTINRVLERMGYAGRFSAHGFRSTASTILNEMGWRGEIIERQLAHAERNKVKAAYNQAEYLSDRRVMMQSWADWLDAQRTGSNIIPLKARA